MAFARRVADDVRERIEVGLDSGAGAYSEVGFTEYVMDFLSETGMVEAPVACHYEGTFRRGQVRISGFALSEDGDQLDLFTTLYFGGKQLEPVPQTDVSRAAERAARFFDAARKGLDKGLEPASQVFELASRIASGSDVIGRIRVFVLTDGLTSVKKINPTELAGIPARFEVFDMERLFRGMQAGLARDEIAVDFKATYGAPIPCLPMPPTAQDYSGYLAIIPGEVLYHLYDEYGPRLLELNVRSFLSARGKVNSGIRTTILREPDRFLAYNNGIVVTVDHVDLETLDDGRPAIRAVKGLQIVNGGQTTASIHRARKVDRADLSAVQVPAKITVIKSEKLDEMVQMISHYANSQNTVQPADFSANDPFHVKVEELASTIWCPGDETRWFYERARGGYQVALAREGTTPARARKFKERTPPQQKFTKTDLAKYLNAWDQKPHLVSYGAQKNFDAFMQGLRSGRRPDWTPDQAYYRHLIAKAILFRTVQLVARQEKFPAHQANITAYLVSYLSWRSGGNLDLEGIWQRQELSEELVALVRDWAHRIDRLLRDSAGARMVTEWAKKENCWSGLRGSDLPFPAKLPPELACRTVVPGERDGAFQPAQLETVEPEDYRNIEICKELDGPTWLRIHAWGRRTGGLRSWQIGIAHTLAGYAASGWEHGPSVKQARQGVRIINIARQAGCDAWKIEGEETAAS
ncbi:hypothetical protein D3093_17345 (plasmid) [Azospirillum argentinense]|uniref:AIPR protein n=2 Tax=Azospirillum argentinense TaxID=2970906 RepID=A0A4D8PN06_9PROT|nr:hypothetical protein D3093_17345 [Azospirillum argentinense]